MAKISAGKQTGWQRALAQAGIDAVAEALELEGWTVLPTEEVPYSDNVDLHIIDGDREAQLSVLTTNRHGWVSGGAVTESVRDGAPIINRAAPPHAQADFAVLVTPAHRVAKREMPEEWRFFIVPVAEAESAFRHIVDSVINRPRSDGSRREVAGSIMSFVGPDNGAEAKAGSEHGDLEDQSARFAPFESAFDQLTRFRPATD